MAELFYLYIILGGYNDYAQVKRVGYPTQEACQKALNEAKVSQSHGAEDENYIVMFCGPDNFQIASGNRFSGVKP